MQNDQRPNSKLIRSEAQADGRSGLSFGEWLVFLGDHLKTGHLWSLQNRPLWMAET